ncbi:MAG TPA: DMT family transporter [Azospira sp.]|nr:DMT family transporter [Azospira sp.]
MSHASLLRLFALSAIWGASFLFMRIGAQVMTPAVLIEARLLLAAVFLALVALWLRRPLALTAHWRHYLILGGLNTALPFLLIAFAAQTLSASLLSILNATAPLWGALIGALLLRTGLSAKTAVGLLLGLAGVALLTGLDESTLRPGALPAVAAALGAALSYAVASSYAKSAAAVEPFANAHGSMWAATLLVAPLLAAQPGKIPADGNVLFAVVALGIVCSGVAYLLYFRLIADIGAAPALTVGFLIPVFGVLWGFLFLDETVGWHTFAGTVVILAGTALVTGFSPRALLGPAGKDN